MYRLVGDGGDGHDGAEQNEALHEGSLPIQSSMGSGGT
jgi:hypothetical protein